MRNDEGRRSEDVEIRFFGLYLKGSVKAVISLLSGSASILALIALVAYHVILDIRYNEQIILSMHNIQQGIDLQNGILIIPQGQRGAFAHRLTPETQRKLGMEEQR